MNVILLAALLGTPAAADMKQAASAVTSIVVAKLGETTTVLSSEDVRNLLEAASNQSLAGCEDPDSCLAEVASALGTQHVVAGKLNRLGSQYVMEATLLDSEAGVVLERLGLTRPTLDELTDALPGLLDRLLAKLPDGTEKVLVTDFKTSQAEVVGATQEDVQSSTIAMTSYIVGGAGVLVLAIGYGVLTYAWAQDSAVGRLAGLLLPVVGPFLYFDAGSATFDTQGPAVRGLGDPFNPDPNDELDIAPWACLQVVGLAVAVGGFTVGAIVGPEPEESTQSASAAFNAPLSVERVTMLY